MTIKPMGPSEIQILQAIHTNRETIKQLELANQALRAMLPQQTPSKARGFFISFQTGERIYYDKPKKAKGG